MIECGNIPPLPKGNKMSRVAIITDTNSGITEEEARAAGMYLVHMPFTINGRDYTEGIDLSHKEFYALMEQDADIHTSQPVAGHVMDVWDSALKNHDEAVYIPMSSALSGSCATARLFAEDYNGRVHVVDNRRISVTQRMSAYDAKALAHNGKTAAEIKEILENTSQDNSIYIMVDTLKYLKKGGRVTGAAAAFAQILNLKPILTIQGDKLDAFSKCRGTKQARTIMINAMKADVEKRFGGIDPEHPKVWLNSVHSNDEASALEFRDEIQKAFPGHSIYVDSLPLSISCHVGPGSLAIACTRIMEDGARSNFTDASSYVNAVSA